MHYRAVNAVGRTFDSVSSTPANGHAMVSWDGGPAYAIPVSPRSPDMAGDLVAFSSGEDLPTGGEFSMRPGELPQRLPQVTWRSWYPGRFDPAGWYHFSGKKGDSTQFPLSGRGARWMYRDSILLGPFETGTTAIEGIATFVTDGQGGWLPVWQNRGKPREVDGYVLPLWVETPHWLYGVNAPSDRSIAKRKLTGQWFLVTNHTSPVQPPCVAEQTDGTLRLAWNGDQEAFLWSGDGWPLVPSPPVVIPTFKKTPLKIGVGLFDDPSGPANIISVGEPIQPNSKAILWGVGTPGQSDARALAKTLNVGAEAYTDVYAFSPSKLPAGFRPLVYAYAKATLTVAQSTDLVRTALYDFHQLGIQCDLAVSTYRQWNGTGYSLPEQQVLDMLKAAWDLAIEFKVGAVWCYTLRKPITGPVILDGILKFPDTIGVAVDRMRGASGDWQHFPPYAESPPPDSFWAKLGDLHMEWAYLKSREYYLTVEPGTEHVQTDRTSPNGWELVRIEKLSNGKYHTTFHAAQRVLSQQPDGTFQTRPAETNESWEQIAGGIIEDGPLAGTRILGACVVEPAPAP